MSKVESRASRNRLSKVPHGYTAGWVDGYSAVRDNDYVSTHDDLDYALDLRVLPRVEWQSAARAHRDRLDRLVGPYLERRATGTTHPVVDFLFT